MKLLKNKGIAIVLVLLMATASLGVFAGCLFAASDYDNRVIDYAGLFYKEEIESMELKIKEFREATGIDLVLMFENDYRLDYEGNVVYEGTLQEYLTDNYEYYEYGVGDSRNAMMMILSVDEGEIETAIFGNIATEDNNTLLENAVYNVMMDYLKDGQFVAGIDHLIDILQSVLTGSPRVLDFADLLTDSEEAKLEERAITFREKNGMDLVFLFHDTIRYNGDYDDFVANFYDYLGYGVGSDHSGVILGVDMAARDYWVLTTGKAESTYPDSIINSINSKFQGKLSDGEYFEAANTYIDGLESVLDGSYKWNRLKGIILWILLGSFLLSALITVFTAWQMKKVMKKMEASEYIVPGSMKLTYSSDRYSHTTRTMTKIEKSSSSSGSSGTSHGGGGGSF